MHGGVFFAVQVCRLYVMESMCMRVDSEMPLNCSVCRIPIMVLVLCLGDGSVKTAARLLFPAAKLVGNALHEH